ncbi:TPM domain-containing protein [Sphingomonas canadensis]|uniref:TPM domain-containing protein n=1 Tax=Sphingomonas canadensis TaxID=1219257 RepID=A0ABW3H3S2_9SPHN|nr:TPM domain-containing protein [Sphingomonas canadensis]MCW3834578.1 TPM domain-containing protein [Sphingomonas canadensis]
MNIRNWLAALLLALLWVPLAHAQNFPALTGRVVDAANLLSPEQEAQLTALSADIEKASSRQFVVATIPDLQDYPIEDYGYRLGRAWKIGQEGANNGILLIVAPKERKVRIEVGYGLEPVMTDALSSLIINDVILPKFRDGDMAGGIMAGAQEIGEQMKLPLEAAEVRAKEKLDAQAQSGGNGDDGPGLWFFIVAIIVIATLAGIGNRRQGRRYRGGWGPVILWSVLDAATRGGGDNDGGGWGGGGGGGFSGGGGSFGGGGASGSW